MMFKDAFLVEQEIPALILGNSCKGLKPCAYTSWECKWRLKGDFPLANRVEACVFSLQHAVLIQQCIVQVAGLLSCIPKLVFYEPFLQFLDETGHFWLQSWNRNPSGAGGSQGLLCHLCTRSPSPAFNY